MRRIAASSDDTRLSLMIIIINYSVSKPCLPTLTTPAAYAQPSTDTDTAVSVGRNRTTTLYRHSLGAQRRQKQKPNLPPTLKPHSASAESYGYESVNGRKLYAYEKSHRTRGGFSLAGVPGLEPRMDEPESPVLPITPYPNWQAPQLLELLRRSYPRPDLNRCWRRERA